MGRLLVVEDDDTIGQALRASLAAHGHDVEWVVTGHAAIECADSAAGATGRAFDLVLLDLGLPDLDGVAVCRELRLRQPETVLVMVTARDEEMDVVIGLEAGADDYLTKPVGLAELHARIRAHLRRGAAPAGPEDDGRTVLGDLVVDTASRRVTVGGAEIVLRAKEFELLARLAAEPGVAVSRETLMSDVWDEHWFGPTKTLDVHVAALRRRLSSAGRESAGDLPTIVTLRGHGYRLDRPGAG